MLKKRIEELSIRVMAYGVANPLKMSNRDSLCVLLHVDQENGGVALPLRAVQRDSPSKDVVSGVGN